MHTKILYTPLNFVNTREDKLLLIMHEATLDQAMEADYVLQGSNIKWLNLGVASPAWHRHLFHKRILQKIFKEIESFDKIIVRSPTPLAPFFSKYVHKSKIVFMIVGDYKEGAKQFKIKSLRDWMMVQYLNRNDFLFRKEMQSTDVMVNSSSLYNKYKTISKSIYQIKTTTLSVNDFYQRKDTCQGEIIELLYTGRIDPAKGLFDLVASMAYLRSLNFNVRLNIAGWEDNEAKPVEKELLLKAKQLGVEKFMIFHGRKTVGIDLNNIYKMADIYAIPSYHEGFPRTIWEAMANGLPVIATTVGAIPECLDHKENAILVTPRDITSLINGIQMVLIKPILRRKLILNGQKLAKENTLELQTKKIIDILKDLIKDE